MRAETLAVHAGRAVDAVTGAVTPPIHLSTTFERAHDGGFPSGFVYSRDDNPNRRMLETCLAALEGSVAAVTFASGMAAITAAIEALPADRPRRVLAPNDLYFGIRSLMAETDLARSVEWCSVDMRDTGAMAETSSAFRPGLVWIESPSNPLLHVTDIAAISEIAHESGALVAVDNTWATPILQQPRSLGADVIVHALTKYLGGHSDLMIGAVIVPAEGAYLDNLRGHQKHKGAVPSPFECWLAPRGISSLAPRLRMQCASALAVAGFLAKHRSVTAVSFPGLPDHPDHALAMRQMSGLGGAMLSFEIGGGRERAMALCNRLKLFIRATSLGGPHSLVEHRASVEGPETLAPPGLLRLSIIGLEHQDDLIADLDQALSES